MTANFADWVAICETKARYCQSADVIWAMNDRVAWSEDRIAAMGDLGHTGYGHYREHYVKCADGKWRIKHQVLSYLTFDKVPLPR
jgi:hypothetical protein